LPSWWQCSPSPSLPARLGAAKAQAPFSFAEATALSTTCADLVTGGADARRGRSRRGDHPAGDECAEARVKLHSKQEPALAHGATLGVLSGERGTAAVTYGDEQPKELTDETSLVPLHSEAVGAGEYTGKVDLTPDDSATGAVTLSLTAKHWWLLALVPLLLGIAIALGVQWINVDSRT
jgi:hypothetical protein